MGIIFKRDRANVKKLQHLKKGAFVIYSPMAVTTEPATSSKIDTDITLILPKNSKGFSTSKFRGDEIFEIKGEKQRLWVEILNRSYLDSIAIKRGSILGFLVIEPQFLSFKHETSKTKKRKGPFREYAVNGRKRKKQREEFLNRYDFAYAGRDVAN